jgi:hypothetical protein
VHHLHRWLLTLFVSGCLTSTPVVAQDWGNLVTGSFESVAPGLPTIEASARGYGLTRWRIASNINVAVAGGGACALPGSLLVAMPLELAYLMRQLYNSSLGVGFIVKGSATREDFANILGVWTDQLHLQAGALDVAYATAEHVATATPPEQLRGMTVVELDRAIARANATGCGKVRTVLETRAMKAVSDWLAARVLGRNTGTQVGGAIAAAVAAKTGAKFAAKFGWKAASNPLPVISPAICAGVNAWLMDSMLDAAESYYTALHEYEQQRYASSHTARRRRR